MSLKDDPAGFCRYCAFVVAVDSDTGLMLAHERVKSIKYGSNAERCYGSLLEPTEQPGPEAWPEPYEKVIADAIAEDGGDD